MANPYGIEQVDVPGILGQYTAARAQRIQQMMQESELAQRNLQLDRETKLHTAYAKFRVPGADSGASAAVSAYGGQTPPATSASPATVAAPMDPSSPTQALASETIPAAPVAPSPVTPAPTSHQGWVQANASAIQDIMRIDPPSGLAAIQSFHQLDADQQQQLAAHLDLADKVNEHGLRLLSGVHDQASWDAARQDYAATFAQYGLPAPQLPDQYTPGMVQALQSHALSVKDQLEMHKGVVMGADTTLNDPFTGAQLATNPKDDLQHFEVHNADGSTTPYAFNPKTGETHQLTEGGLPAGGSPGGTSPKMAAVASTLTSAGLPAPVVAGFMGNFHIEGGYDGAQGDGGSASGIGQWHADRVANFQRVIGKPVTEASPADQAKFVTWEMQNPQAAGMTVAQRDAILAAKTPAQAAALIDQYYERSNGKARQARMAAATAFAGGSGTATAATGKPITGAPLSANADDVDTAKFIGGQVAMGQPMPPLGMGKQAAQMRAAILSEATKQWKAMGITPGEANVIAAQNKSGLAELGRIATIKASVQTAENTANSNANQVLSLLGSTGTTGVPIFNSWQQAGRRSVAGDSKIAAFDVAVKTLATEYARVMSGGNSQQLSDSARHEADALIHTSMTPGQFRAAIKQMQIDMSNRSAGIEQERQATLNQIRTGGRGAAPAAPAPNSNGAPALGEVRRGYRYKGGPPGSPSSWQKM